MVDGGRQVFDSSDLEVIERMKESGFGFRGVPERRELSPEECVSRVLMVLPELKVVEVKLFYLFMEELEWLKGRRKS